VLLGNASADKIYEWIAAGRLESFMLGRARYVTVTSIDALIAAELAIASTTMDDARAARARAAKRTKSTPAAITKTKVVTASE